MLKSTKMNKFKFRTNIMCKTCVDKIRPFFDGDPRIISWHVALEKPSKELTVETEELSEDTIIGIVQKAGFKARVRSKTNLLDRIFG
jgi:copper chaperone